MRRPLRARFIGAVVLVVAVVAAWWAWRSRTLQSSPPPPSKAAGLATIRLTTIDRTEVSVIASVEVEV